MVSLLAQVKSLCFLSYFLFVLSFRARAGRCARDIESALMTSLWIGPREIGCGRPAGRRRLHQPLRGTFVKHLSASSRHLVRRRCRCVRYQREPPVLYFYLTGLRYLFQPAQITPERLISDVTSIIGTSAEQRTTNICAKKTPIHFIAIYSY